MGGGQPQPPNFNQMRPAPNNMNMNYNNNNMMRPAGPDFNVIPPKDGSNQRLLNSSAPYPLQQQQQVNNNNTAPYPMQPKMPQPMNFGNIFKFRIKLF